MTTAPTLSAHLVLDRLGPEAAISHESAARLHGLELLEPGGEHVTVPRDRSRRRQPGWRVHRRDLGADDVAIVDGVRVTRAVRTVHDLSRRLPLGQALAVAESAVRHKRASAGDLRQVLGASLGAWAGTPRAVAALVEDGGSVLESLAAGLFHEQGLPAFRRQYLVCEDDGTFVARVDFCWPEHRLVVEVDGFAFHSDRDAYRRDRQRLNGLVRLGWRVLRFTYEDVCSRPDHVVRTVTGCLHTTAG